MERNAWHSVTCTLSTSNIERNHHQMWNIIHKINIVMPSIHLLCCSRGCFSRWRLECSHRQERTFIFRPIPIFPLPFCRTSNELMNVNRIQILCIASSDLLPGHFGHFPCRACGQWNVRSFVAICANEEKGFHSVPVRCFSFYLIITVINFVNDFAWTESLAEYSVFSARFNGLLNLFGFCAGNVSALIQKWKKYAATHSAVTRANIELHGNFTNPHLVLIGSAQVA